MIYTLADLLALSQNHQKNLGEIARHLQSEEEQVSESDLNRYMLKALNVMKESISAGLNPDLRSMSSRVGGQSSLLLNHPASTNFMGDFFQKACTYALAVAENNAAMGKIVAAPTAGACGILPGILFAAQETMGYSDDALVDALFTAAAIGKVIAETASISGAQGGCQAECGSAAAMAAGALTQLQGGNPEMVLSACSFVIMNVLGLVCDPVDGLVEIPCVYRNVGAIGNVQSASYLALCGIPSPIPVDEVIKAMKEVGDAMPSSLRETGEGGCAGCLSMAKRITN